MQSTFVALCMVVMMAALDIAVTGPALPAICTSFGMEVATRRGFFGYT
ncbi:MAG: hypothetical protein NT020_06085 [Chloroflexales bacterium]|nr:hypothetical protein [Chloroflexales bacterium]